MFASDSHVVKPTDFGILYPVGYIVAGFLKFEDAVCVRKDLMTGGYESADCVLQTGAEVSAMASTNLAEHTGWLARLGKSDEILQLQLDAANQGATFLHIFVPTDSEAKRAMNVVRRVPFELAHRYGQFTIEDMKVSSLDEPERAVS